MSLTYPTVAIITSTQGKRPEFLAEAMDSVDRQTGRELEGTSLWHIVVVNTDDEAVRRRTTAELRESAGRSKWASVLVLDGDGSCYGAGANEALESDFLRDETDYVGFLDDDDIFLIDHLDRLLRAFREGRSSVAYSDSRVVRCDERNRPLEIVRTFEGPFTRAELHQDNRRPLHSVLVRTAALEGLRFDTDPETRLLADWGLLLALDHAGRSFRHVPGVTAEYRLRGTGASNNDSARLVEQTDRVRALWAQRRG